MNLPSSTERVQSWGFYGPPPMTMWGGTVDERPSVPPPYTTCRTSQMTWWPEMLASDNFSYRAANWRGWFLFLSCFDYQRAELLFLNTIPWTLGFGHLRSKYLQATSGGYEVCMGEVVVAMYPKRSSVARNNIVPSQRIETNKLQYFTTHLALRVRGVPKSYLGPRSFSNGEAIPKFRRFERPNILRWRIWKLVPRDHYVRFKTNPVLWYSPTYKPPRHIETLFHILFRDLIWYLNRITEISTHLG
jgi:hypothetical protein